MVPRINIGASTVIRFGLGLYFAASAMAFDMSSNTNLAVYWGQNSFGAANPGDAANGQQSIEFYCGDDTVDMFPVAFLNEFFSTGNLPTINLANTCSTVGNPVFPGTNLPNCSFLASGIETCQKAGKAVTLSMGGASGSVGFSSDSEGEAYAQVIWDLFLGGSSMTRPFGSAVLDGIDMDIEGGSQTGFVAFLNALRTLMNGGNKKYYITAAPQCPFPDANIGNTLNGFGFDAVFVQFYNNFCEVSNFANGDAFNFGTWDNWAKTQSPNKDVKVYIGAPGSSSAAGSGFVSSSTLATIVSQTQSKYNSFGGVMLWDASQANANGYDKAAKAALGGSGGSGSAPPSSSASGPAPSSVQPTNTATSASTIGGSGGSSSAPPSSASTPAPSPGQPTSTARSTSTTSGSGGSGLVPPSSASGSAPSSVKPTSTAKNAPKTTSAGAGITATVSAASPSGTPSGGTCAGVAAWSSNIIYLEGDEATYNGQLWKAEWWTQQATPGAPYDGWKLVGSC